MVWEAIQISVGRSSSRTHSYLEFPNLPVEETPPDAESLATRAKCWLRQRCADSSGLLWDLEEKKVESRDRVKLCEGFCRMRRPFKAKLVYLP